MSSFLKNLRTLTVHSRAAYPSWNKEELDWRDQDYDANFYVHGIKLNLDKVRDRAKALPIGAAVLRGGGGVVHRALIPSAFRRPLWRALA